MWRRCVERSSLSNLTSLSQRKAYPVGGVSGCGYKHSSLNFVLCTLDLAQHFLMKANITAIRRVKKSDNNRIAR